MTLSAPQLVVLKAVRQRPRWMKGMAHLRGVVASLRRQGLIDMVAPEGTIHKNKIVITPAGIDALEAQE